MAKLKFSPLSTGLIHRINSYREEMLLGGYRLTWWLSELFSDTVRPLKTIKDDFIATVQPYKRSSLQPYVEDDIVQPFRGLWTTIEGAIAFILFPFLVVGFVALAPFKLLNAAFYGIKALRSKTSSKNNKALLEQKAIHNLNQIVALAALAMSALLGGLFKVFRGVTQIVTTPLTWFFKIPFRSLLGSSVGKTGFLGRLQGYRKYDFTGRYYNYDTEDLMENLMYSKNHLGHFLKKLSNDMLRPLYAMKNDFFATKKLYHSRQERIGNAFDPANYRVGDAIQPIRGIGTTLEGVVGIVAFPLFVVALAVWAPFKLVGALGKAIITKATEKQFEQPAAADAKQVVGFAALTAYTLLGGALKMVRGLTQIATTPLTWFFRIPYRSHVTAQEAKKKASYDMMNEQMAPLEEEEEAITESSKEDPISYSSLLKHIIRGKGSATSSSTSSIPQQQTSETSTFGHQ